LKKKISGNSSNIQNSNTPEDTSLPAPLCILSSQLSTSQLAVPQSKMATVASFAFKCIESHTNTNDIVDLIANKLHRIGFNDGIKDDIEKRKSLFENIFFEYEGNRLTALYEKYPDMEIYIDEYYEWTTIIFHLTKTRFILCHEYMETFMDHNILVEGDISSTNEIDIERFYHYQRNIAINSISEYLESGFNHIPFQFLCKMINRRVPYKHFQGIKQTVVRKWFNPKEICKSLTNINTITMIKEELEQMKQENF